MNAQVQAGITIIGEPLNNANDQTNVHDFINNDLNPYTDNNTNGPPSQNQMAELNKGSQEGNIEPSLENGFHMRFELSSTATTERISTTGYMSSGSGSAIKAKKHSPSMTERSFNAKKKIRSVLPKRKKKYRPHLCGRF